MWRTRRSTWCWLQPRFWAVLCYRLERAVYLLCAPSWPLLQHPVKLLLSLIRPPNVEISPLADIGGGLRIYHPALGIVVSPHAQVGAKPVEKARRTDREWSGHHFWSQLPCNPSNRSHLLPHIYPQAITRGRKRAEIV